MEGYFDAVWVLTQNVDGLHQAAGSHHVIDVHGDLHELRCTVCRFHEHGRADYSGLGLPPYCPECGGVLRPDVVLFGEHLPEAKLRRLEAEIVRGFDLVFSIGTSSLFDYIVAPLRMAQAAGKTTVEINPDVTAASGLVDFTIQRERPCGARPDLGRLPRLVALEVDHQGSGDVVEDAPEDVVGREALGVGLVADDDPVAEDVAGQRLDVVRA